MTELTTLLVAGKADLAKAEKSLAALDSSQATVKGLVVDTFVKSLVCIVLVDSVGPTLRGAAKCRTLQEGLRRPLSISGHSGEHRGLRVGLTSYVRELAHPLGRFCDTMRGTVSSCSW